MRTRDVIAHDHDRQTTSIFEAAHWGYTVKVECRCRRVGLFEAHGLWWKFHRKGWTDDFRDAIRCFYCTSCSKRYGRKVRPVSIETTREPPRIKFPPSDEREWKKAVSRHRG